MSGGAKFIIAVVVLVLVLFGAWYWLKGNAAAPVDTTQIQATTTQPVAQTPPPQQQNLLTSNDMSDAALASDMAAIDGQMGVASQDSSQVDSSLNDKSAQ